MKFYTINGSMYTVDYVQKTLTGEKIGTLSFLDVPVITLGQPAVFDTNRGKLQTSRVVKMQEDEVHYKLFHSTDKNLKPFETRYGYSLVSHEPVPIERPLLLLTPMDDSVVFETLGSDFQITMHPLKVEEDSFKKDTGYGMAYVKGIMITTEKHTHIFYKEKVKFI